MTQRICLIGILTTRLESVSIVSTLYFFFKFVNLFERVIESRGWGEREREKEVDIFHRLVHSPHGHSDWSCAGPKPGASSGSPMCV